MTFSRSVSTYLRKYAVFDGRARRSEYWWFVVFQTLVMVGLGIPAVVSGEVVLNVLFTLFMLGTLVPYIAVTARRLHDVNRSGWWHLISMTIPIFGWILFMYWLCKGGDAQANSYGPVV